MLQSINPATGEIVATYEETKPKDVIAAIEAAHKAHVSWRRLGFAERAAPMRRAAQILRDKAKDYARLIAVEMGKPLRDGIAEIQKCAGACDFYAEQAEVWLRPEVVIDGSSRQLVAFEPLGVILAVMPWNFPFWQMFRFAAPGLMAGNGAILKHASNVPGCALAIEEVFREAGFPEGLMRTLLVGSRAVDQIIEHPLIRAITLTGSGPAGRAVAAKAGAMLKKTVLELGGADAYLVLEDADLELAASVSTKGRLVNAGQSCVAAKRFIVVDSLRRRFEEAFVEKMRAVKMGDPLEDESEIGPMARQDLRDELHDQVRASIEKGAKCLCGGELPNRPGAFYPPTVLTDVRPGMPAYDDELFGPVASVIPVKDEAAAIAVANDSPFGLGGGIFSRDLKRAEKLAIEEIEAGMVFVNSNVVSTVKLPFGGIKESGYGRELSHYGLKEFVNIKTVVVAGAGS